MGLTHPQAAAGRVPRAGVRGGPRARRRGVCVGRADRTLFNLLAEASTKTGIPKSRFVRYAIQPFSYTELAPGTTDWNDVYRTDPDPEHPLKRGRQLNVMLTGDEYEMLCRAAFKLGIARSAWVRERVYALLCRSYADELSPLTDASIRDNATMLLKELKTKDAGR